MLVPTFDDKSQTWTQGDNSFQPQPNSHLHKYTIQDINSHWAISFQVMDDDKVYVLDSLYNYLSVIMTIQMSQIYRNSRNTENILGGLNVSIPSKLNKQILGSRNSGNTENILNVSIPSKLHKQILGSECGLFAIANLVLFGRV